MTRGVHIDNASADRIVPCAVRLGGERRVFAQDTLHVIISEGAPRTALLIKWKRRILAHIAKPGERVQMEIDLRLRHRQATPGVTGGTACLAIPRAGINASMVAHVMIYVRSSRGVVDLLARRHFKNAAKFRQISQKGKRPARERSPACHTRK